MEKSLNKAYGIQDDYEDNQENGVGVPIQAKSEFIKSMRAKIMEIYSSLDATSSMYSSQEKIITKYFVILKTSIFLK